MRKAILVVRNTALYGAPFWCHPLCRSCKCDYEEKEDNVPVADTDFVAKSPTQAFSLVLANTPPRWSGTMRWISILMVLTFLRHPKEVHGPLSL